MSCHLVLDALEQAEAKAEAMARLEARQPTNPLLHR
jgi:hypothetical protein